MCCRRRSGFVVELRISSADANRPDADEQQTVRIIVIIICRRRLLPDGYTTCWPRSLELLQCDRNLHRQDHLLFSSTTALCYPGRL